MIEESESGVRNISYRPLCVGHLHTLLRENVYEVRLLHVLCTCTMRKSCLTSLRCQHLQQTAAQKYHAYCYIIVIS